MPERGFDTGYWGDPFVMKLPKDAKFLYVYLWTNPHCNPAGLYEIAPETITFETKLPAEDLPSLFELLTPKVQWYPEGNIVWVKNFIKRQAKSSKFLAAAAKCLLTIHNNGAVKELLDYNLETYSISIPYQYYMDRVSLLTRAPASAAVSVSGISDSVSVQRKRDSKGEGELGNIRRLYEENIGELTPVVEEALKAICWSYPSHWFAEAIKEAVRFEHRNLKYVEAILERWKVEGFRASKGKAKNSRDKYKTQKHAQLIRTGNNDPDKYIKGQYGHMVRR